MTGTNNTESSGAYGKLTKEEANRRLYKAIFGDMPIKKTDCETCELQYDCERINGKDNINGCLK